MNEYGQNVDTQENPYEVFEPNYLNLEYFFNQVLSFFRDIGQTSLDASGGTYFLPEIKAIASFVSVIAITVILYVAMRMWELKQEEKEQYNFAEPLEVDSEYQNERWELVQKHINSDSPAEWRMAIIEADSMLDDMVQRMGYEGDNLGERLKAVEPSDFQTLQNAWEAHKVRNKIAHEGVSFVVSQREARRVVELYRTVFEEFHYI